MSFKVLLDRFVRFVRPVAADADATVIESRPPAAAAIEAVRAASAAPSRMATRFSASTRADTYAIGPDTSRAEALRRPTHDDDFVLSDAADAWMFELPPTVRPEWTMLLFPRIANRIARCWRDADLLDALFDDLLHDRRGSRAGLPPQVHDELVRLDKHRRRVAQAGAAEMPHAAPAAPARPNRAIPAEAIDILL